MDDHQLPLSFDAPSSGAINESAAHPGPGHPPWCSPDEQILIRILEAHRGKAAAIKLPDLASATGIPGRMIQEIVAHLVVDHGLPIGGCHRGIYMIETAEELNEVCATLRHRALGTLKHMAALRKQHLAELLGQLRLDLEEGDHDH